MAKHPVPKKKMSQARTAMRYAAFANKKYKKIKSIVNVVTCSGCGAPKVNQYACAACGNYRGRSVKGSKASTGTVTKIKA